MSKSKKIFLLGALFFLLALVKYIFMSDALPTNFIVFEILSFLVVLYIIYFVLNFIDTCMHGSDAANMDRECIHRQTEITRLKNKLERYESNDGDESGDKGDKDELLSELKITIGGLSNDSATKTLDLLSSHYEIMAAIAYSKNTQGQYETVKTFGVDEDEIIPPIELEDGIHAQAIADNSALEIKDIPADYINVGSGTGNAQPSFLYVLPLVNAENGIVIELASFKKLDIIEVWNQLSTQQ